MNDKGKLISEKDVEELALKLYKEQINKLQEKEKFISQLPYSDEYPRLITSKGNSCHTIVLRSIYLSAFFSFAFGYLMTNMIYSN
jgi:hypothetical protein